jgi:hypothetical protein
MTTLNYLEKIDDTLSHWEDYFHGQEGTDVTEARSNLNKVRNQLLIHSVVKTFYCMAANSQDGFTEEKCKEQCKMCKSGQ